METRGNSRSKDNEKRNESNLEGNNETLFEILNEKMDILIEKTIITNELLQELIDVNKKITLASEHDRSKVPSKSDVIEQNTQIEVNEITLKNEAVKIKRRIGVIWNDLLAKRKMAYWSYLRNKNYSELYETWISKDVPVLPRKYRIKKLRYEEKEETNIRIEMAVNRMRGEIQILKIKSTKAHDSMRDYDNAIDAEISRLSSGTLRETVMNVWYSECEQQQQVSYNRWRYSETWLLDYEKNYGNTVFKEYNKYNHNQNEQNNLNSKRNCGMRNTLSKYETETKGYRPRPHSSNNDSNTRTRRTYASVVRGHNFTRANSSQRSNSYHRRNSPSNHQIHQSNNHPYDRYSPNAMMTNDATRNYERSNRHETYRISRNTKPFLGGGKPLHGYYQKVSHVNPRIM